VSAQRSFDDLGSPLHEVTFCVVDLETTGGSPKDCTITEFGAVKLRGGECLGTFQTLVNPGQAIPPNITVLTGITEAMVYRAPRVEDVLPSFLEFLGDAIIVGHNVRFDLSFLNAALERDHRPKLTNRPVDTCALARRLVAEEVPNCKLGTLASRFRLDHSPSHRALDDALATGDLLHILIERATALGVTGLDDLLALPTMAGHAQAPKLRMTEGLPRSPGVYLFRDQRGAVLYVGKAANLRARVRSYFSSDTRRKIGGLLREAARVDHIVCSGQLEAAVLEVRLIHHHQPRFNRQGKRTKSYSYVKLTKNERFPRLSVARKAKSDGGLYLGPLPSAKFAKRVIEAIEAATPIRRCTDSGKLTRLSPCAPAQLGVSSCPCSGAVAEQEYAAIVARVERGLTLEPELLLEPLQEQMARLAQQERFEEAADMRDRAAALTTALERQRRFDSLRRAGTMRIISPGGGAILHQGRLVKAWEGQELASLFDSEALPDVIEPGAPLPASDADELNCVAAWLDKEAHQVTIMHSDQGLSAPLPRLPSFAQKKHTVMGASSPSSGSTDL
jgi:DNA polymerase-3 subunit epsilon